MPRQAHTPAQTTLVHLGSLSEISCRGKPYSQRTLLVKMSAVFSFAVRCFRWEELCIFGELINDYEHSVESLALREFRYEVHGDNFERLGRDGNGLH